MSNEGLTYKDAGVDIEAQDALVERIRDRAKATLGPGVLSGVGGFASLFSLKDAAAHLSAIGSLDDPILVSGTDGVGTKLKIAFATGVHDTVGIDLVAMCVNDVLTTGAVPLFFLDYFGTGKLDADVGATVVSGIARGCELAGCALVGGETAELPGLYAPGEYDLAGFAVGVVDRSQIIDGRRVAAGDVVIGVASSGIHSNGLSLARGALLDRAGYQLDQNIPALGRSLAEELLTPTSIYAEAVAALRRDTSVKALAHITGGGIEGNLPRVMPTGVLARLDRAAWKVPAIFELIQDAGKVASAEMDRTFNMGLGLIAIVAPNEADAALASIRASGHSAWTIGQIEAAERADAEAEVRFA